MPSRPIRLLIVEDSPVALAILQRILREAPDIEVVGTARHGLEALALIPEVKPTMICTDLHMPKMNGLELTREVMAQYPCPILVVSASVQEEDTQNVFKILEAGALDIFPKPRTGLAAEYERSKNELLAKLRVLSGVSVFTQHRRQATSARPVAAPPPTPIPAPAAIDIRAPRIVAIGASTGGPQALLAILQQLPRTFPVPILCVQHISAGFFTRTGGLARQQSAAASHHCQGGRNSPAGCRLFPPGTPSPGTGCWRPVELVPICPCGRTLSLGDRSIPSSSQLLPSLGGRHSPHGHGARRGRWAPYHGPGRGPDHRPG